MKFVATDRVQKVGVNFLYWLYHWMDFELTISFEIKHLPFNVYSIAVVMHHLYTLHIRQKRSPIIMQWLQYGTKLYVTLRSVFNFDLGTVSWIEWHYWQCNVRFCNATTKFSLRTKCVKMVGRRTGMFCLFLFYL